MASEVCESRVDENYDSTHAVEVREEREQGWGEVADQGTCECLLGVVPMIRMESAVFMLRKKIKRFYFAL